MLTLSGVWSALRLPVHALLLGTVTVALFGRCAIALTLERMPWNCGREVRLKPEGPMRAGINEVM